MFAWTTLQPVLRREWLAKRLGPLGRPLRQRARSSAGDDDDDDDVNRDDS